MTQIRQAPPAQHLLIDDDALEEMILASLEAVNEADETAPATEVASSEAGDIPAAADSNTGVPGEIETGEAPVSSSGLRYDDIEFLSLPGMDDVNVVSIPLQAVSASGLLTDSDDQFATDTAPISLSATLPEQFSLAGSGVTVLDFEPLAKPDNPGGDKGGNGGGGNGGGGKGGGKPDKGGGDPDVVSTYTSGADNGSDYNVQIEFSGTWTAALQSAFIKAADLISSLITDDVIDISYNGTFYDDIIISAELVSIDGPGGILGQAGPTLIRTGSGMPIAAIMQFDSADASNYDAAGLWDDIVLHEMLHSIGIGTVWDYAGLLNGNGTANPTFNGEFANLAYDELFADLNTNLSDLIPVEADGGPGTAYGHWDDATFGNELMTGYINGSNYVSAMTVASLEDLGYATTWDASDPGATGIGTIVI